MKTLSTSALFLAFTVGFCVSTVSPAWAQQNEAVGNAGSPEWLGQHVVGTFPVGDPPPAYVASMGDGIRSTVGPEFIDEQPSQPNVITQDSLFPEVKNVNFFGVDRNKCCDEWEGMCDCKSPEYRCNCGGIKANKGHLGSFWLKSKYGGEDCDYCNGGRCEKKCKNRMCNLAKNSPMKNSLKRFYCKDCRADSCEGCDDSAPTSIFGRPLESNCDRRGRCDKGCPPEKDCQSCK